MQRRQILFSGLTLAAAPMLNLGRCRLFGATFSTRTLDLIARSQVVDMLSLPTLNWAQLEAWQQNPQSFTQADFMRLRTSGIRVFHPAVAFTVPNPKLPTQQWFAKWNRLIALRPEYFYRVDNIARLDNNRIGILLGMQDASHFETLRDVDTFYAAGQRLAQLTYNSSNELGDGCMVATDRGLTSYGAAVVSHMNQIGMAIDISHCGEKTSMDAVAASKKPVLITHSNCRALAPPVARCKSDELIRAAAKGGGVLGITGVRHFVRATDPVTIEDVLDHFDHAVNLTGVEHVGLGSDTDLEGRDPAGSPHRYDIYRLNSVGRVYELTEGLTRRGYSDAAIELMLGENFRRALYSNVLQDASLPESKPR